MTPVDQTIIGEHGDCFRACIASVLGLPLEAVPEGSGYQGYEAKLAPFLSERGLAYCEVWIGNMTRGRSENPPMAAQHLGWQPLIYSNPFPVCILCGPSPNGPWSHAVVGRANGWSHEVLHDPNPSRKGILGVERIGYFVALDPAEAARKAQALFDAAQAAHALLKNVSGYEDADDRDIATARKLLSDAGWDATNADLRRRRAAGSSVQPPDEQGADS